MFLRLARENRLNPKSTYTCFKRANRDEGPREGLGRCQIFHQIQGIMESFEEEDESRVLLRK